MQLIAHEEVPLEGRKMEIHELGICPECDQSYPIHRLWCDGCGEGLTRQAKIPTDSEVHRLRRELGASIHLYEQVLHDLKGLSRTDQLEPWLQGKIRDFYRNRVCQTKAQKRAVVVRKCLLSAHDMAIQRGDLEGALIRLREGLDQSPKVTAFKEMRQEIRGRLKDRAVLTRPSDPAPALVPEVHGAMAVRPKPLSSRFVQEEKIPNPAQRFVEEFSGWSRPLRPFLLDNAGWFVGVCLSIAGYVALLTTFWEDIEGNRLLRQCLLFLSLFLTTGLCFSLACYMRVKYAELEASSNVVLIIVSLLTPLVFIAAVLITLVPA